MNAIIRSSTKITPGKEQIPGISIISEDELRILDSLNCDNRTISSILTAKAVFGGVICESGN